jgi:hypothetical protein
LAKKGVQEKIPSISLFLGENFTLTLSSPSRGKTIYFDTKRGCTPLSTPCFLKGKLLFIMGFAPLKLPLR